MDSASARLSTAAAAAAATANQLPRQLSYENIQNTCKSIYQRPQQRMYTLCSSPSSKIQSKLLMNSPNFSAATEFQFVMENTAKITKDPIVSIKTTTQIPSSPPQPSLPTTTITTTTTQSADIHFTLLTTIKQYFFNMLKIPTFNNQINACGDRKCKDTIVDAYRTVPNVENPPNRMCTSSPTIGSSADGSMANISASGISVSFSTELNEPTMLTTNTNQYHHHPGAIELLDNELSLLIGNDNPAHTMKLIEIMESMCEQQQHQQVQEQKQQDFEHLPIKIDNERDEMEDESFEILTYPNDIPNGDDDDDDDDDVVDSYNKNINKSDKPNNAIKPSTSWTFLKKKTGKNINENIMDGWMVLPKDNFSFELKPSLCDYDDTLLASSSSTTSPSTNCNGTNNEMNFKLRFASESSDDFICFEEIDNSCDDDDETEDVNYCSKNIFGTSGYNSDSDCDSSDDENDIDDADGDDDEDDDDNDDDVDVNGKQDKKVRFNLKPTVHEIRAWNFAYRQARKGHWEQYALDRSRFHCRINRMSDILNPILLDEHRTQIFNNRFQTQTSPSSPPPSH